MFKNCSYLVPMTDLCKLINLITMLPCIYCLIKRDLLVILTYFLSMLKTIIISYSDIYLLAMESLLGVS